MKLATLTSGGKDSLYALFLAKKAGHEIKYLATIISKNPESFMWHTINIGLTVLQSRVLGIPLVSKSSAGQKEKEIEDLRLLLKDLDIEGVACGGISSEYQRKRIKKVCKELKLKLLAPLWGKPPEQLLREMLAEQFEIIITAVAAEGFDSSWLGRKINEKCIADLIELNKKYGINISAEGGEYETLVLDCPLFRKKIKILKTEKIWDKKTQSGQLIIKDAKLVEK